MRTCLMCGTQFEGGMKKKYCPDCIKKRDSEAHKKHYKCMKYAFKQTQLSKFGNFNNFCQWAKNQLNGIDLTPYMPKKEEK